VHEEDGSAVASVHLDEEADQRASTALVVKPDARGRRHGRDILRALMARPEVAHLRTIEAMIEPENVASLHCFRAAGFCQVGSGPDREGLLKLAYNMLPHLTRRAGTL
jgi:L-amino acid N-acyltransferase YncA